MVKLILLDRDGVINKELGAYVTNPIDFELLPHVIPNLLKLKRAGILVVVITNQGGIAKGLYAHQTLTQIHKSYENVTKRSTIIQKLFTTSQICTFVLKLY